MPRGRRNPCEAHFLKCDQPVQPGPENRQCRLDDLLFDVLGDVCSRLNGGQDDSRGISFRIIADALLIRFTVLIASTMSAARRRDRHQDEVGAADREDGRLGCGAPVSITSTSCES